MTTRVEAELAERGYTFSELMVAAASREIRDAELVFVGMRLPMLAFLVARRTHAPNAVGLFENGVIRETPSPGTSVHDGATRQIFAGPHNAARCSTSWGCSSKGVWTLVFLALRKWIVLAI